MTAVSRTSWALTRRQSGKRHHTSSFDTMLAVCFYLFGPWLATALGLRHVCSGFDWHSSPLCFTPKRKDAAYISMQARKWLLGACRLS